MFPQLSYKNASIIPSIQSAVKRQIEIAADRKLEISQEDVKLNGHAIEARVYAENPLTFVPSPGIVEKLRLPPASAHVRIDHALEEGIRVTPYYDPLLAKIMVWDLTRKKAIERLRSVLSHVSIEGVDTTILTIQKILSNRGYINGKVDTSFLNDMGTSPLD